MPLVGEIQLSQELPDGEEAQLYTAVPQKLTSGNMKEEVNALAIFEKACKLATANKLAATFIIWVFRRSELASMDLDDPENANKREVILSARGIHDVTPFSCLNFF